MKPILGKITKAHKSSFGLKPDILSHINIPLHFHPDYELVYIVKSKGKRFVSDCVENFDEVDLVWFILKYRERRLVF